MKYAGVGLVYAYRYTLGLALVVLDPVTGNRCKYHPSCSEYAIDAFRELGLVRGFVLTLWRLLRCNPWSNGGLDPVDRQRLFKRAA